LSPRRSPLTTKPSLRNGRKPETVLITLESEIFTRRRGSPEGVKLMLDAELAEFVLEQALMTGRIAIA
jgi:hypothetical protein